MEQVLEEAVRDETRTAERIDIYELMLLRHSPAMFASFRRGEMARPFRPRPLPDRVKKLSLAYTVEDAVNRLEARIVQAPVNPGKGKPYGRDTQKTAEYLAGIGVPLEQALFEEDLRSIAEFKQAMLPKMGNAKLIPVEPDEAKAEVEDFIISPRIYRVEENGVFLRNVILETTSNWDIRRDLLGNSDYYGFNDRTRSRVWVRGIVAKAYADDISVLLAESVPPYRLTIKHLLYPFQTWRDLVAEYRKAVEFVADGRVYHESELEIWPRDLGKLRQRCSRDR